MRKTRHPWLMSFMSEIPATGGDTAQEQTVDEAVDTPDTSDKGTQESKTPAEKDSDNEGEGSNPPEKDDKPLGVNGMKALDAERTLRKAAEAHAREAKAEAEAAKADADARVALVTARFEAAAAAGIPVELASRLQGSTREELEADAQALAAHLRPAFVPPTDPSQGKDREGSKGGGVAAGRDLYHEIHKGKKEKN